MSDLEKQEIAGIDADVTIAAPVVKRGKSDAWEVWHGDCVEVMRGLPAASVDLSVFSPPFASLYTYSADPRDMGNCRNETEFFAQFRHLATELARVMKPGRNVACHVSQVPAMLSRDGYIGLKDFRGRVIQTFIDAGLIHAGEICVDKNPQAQAIRTKAKSLLFAQLRKDSSWMRPALADFVIVFRAAGENAIPVKPDITNDEWIKWAHPLWYDIDETDTLSVREAREEKDEKHLCALQLGLIERCIRLWSNPGEVVLSPFAGIGSEGYQAVKFGRKFIGAELKASYWRQACINVAKAEHDATQPNLFAQEHDA